MWSLWIQVHLTAAVKMKYRSRVRHKTPIERVTVDSQQLTRLRIDRLMSPLFQSDRGKRVTAGGIWRSSIVKSWILWSYRGSWFLSKYTTQSVGGMRHTFKPNFEIIPRTSVNITDDSTIYIHGIKLSLVATDISRIGLLIMSKST